MWAISEPCKNPIIFFFFCFLLCTEILYIQKGYFIMIDDSEFSCLRFCSFHGKLSFDNADFVCNLILNYAWERKFGMSFSKAAFVTFNGPVVDKDPLPKVYTRNSWHYRITLSCELRKTKSRLYGDSWPGFNQTVHTFFIFFFF